MKELKVIENGVQMSSMDIADITGKNHQHVMRDIRNEVEKLGEKGQSIFGQSSYINSQNKEQPCYVFGRKGAMQLALKYDAVTRYKVIEKIEEIESKSKKVLRDRSKKTRVKFTDTLKEHGYTKKHEYIQTTMQMKNKLEIVNKKDNCSEIELAKIATAEMLAWTNILVNEAQGFNQVNPICVNSSEQIQKLTIKEISLVH